MTAKGDYTSVKERAVPARGYISIIEAAELIGVTDRTVRQMIADGRLKAYSISPRIVRIKLADLEAAMRPYGGAA